MKKYMIIERFHPNKVQELYARFEEKGRMLPEGVHYIESWIEENVKICFQLMESETLDALHQWIEKWKDLSDFEIVPVISSAEAKKLVL